MNSQHQAAPAFSSEDHNALRLEKLALEVGKKVLLDLFLNKFQQQNSSISLQIWLNRIYLAHCKTRVFNRSQLQLMDTSYGPVNPSDFDITLLSLLLIKFFSGSLTSQEKLYIEEVRNERNAICHRSQFRIANTEFIQKWNTISSALLALGADSNSILEIQNTNIFSDEDVKESIWKFACDYLKRHYQEKFRVISPLPWNPDKELPFADVYQRLKLREYDSSERETDTTNDQIPSLSILKDVPPASQTSSGKNSVVTHSQMVVDIESILQAPGERHLVTAPAGSGKTTLLKHLAREWAIGSILKDRKMIIFLSLRYANFNDGFLSIIKEQLFPGWPINQFDTLVKTIYDRENKLVLLMDGYDELSACVKSKLDDLFILKTIYENMVMVLTSRPESTLKIASKADNVYHIFPFDLEDIETYVKSKFPWTENREHNIASLLSHLNLNPPVRQVASIPFNLYLVCELWEIKDKINFDRTFTSFFQEVIVLLYNYHQNREKTSDSYRSTFDSQFHRQLIILGRIAFDGLRDRNQGAVGNSINAYIWPEEYLLDSGVSNEMLKLGILINDKSINGIKMTSKWSFIHLLFQEYVAAFYVVNCVLSAINVKSKDAILGIIRPIFSINSDPILLFTVGLLGKHADLFFEAWKATSYPCQEGIMHSCIGESMSGINVERFIVERFVWNDNYIINIWGTVLGNLVLGIGKVLQCLKHRQHSLKLLFIHVLGIQASNDNLEKVFLEGLRCVKAKRIVIGSSLISGLQYILSNVHCLEIKVHDYGESVMGDSNVLRLPFSKGMTMSNNLKVVNVVGVRFCDQTLVMLLELLKRSNLVTLSLNIDGSPTQLHAMADFLRCPDSSLCMIQININLSWLRTDKERGTPCHSQYLTEEERLTTFDGYDDLHCPEDWASAGFFHCAEKTLRCFFCNLEIDSREDNDGPWEVHATEAPLCSHILSKKGENFLNYVLRKHKGWGFTEFKTAMETFHYGLNTTPINCVILDNLSEMTTVFELLKLGFIKDICNMNTLFLQESESNKPSKELDLQSFASELVMSKNLEVFGVITQRPVRIHQRRRRGSLVLIPVTIPFDADRVFDAKLIEKLTSFQNGSRKDEVVLRLLGDMIEEEASHSSSVKTHSTFVHIWQKMKVGLN